jgi:WD40 repeat protein/serine/threonine protein kinase/tetratricopeptide (TPR) repeat protein
MFCMNEGNKREEAVFEAALALPPDQRSAYLDKACADDPTLRRQVDTLLEAHEQTTGLLEQPPTPLRESLVALNAPLTEKPGDRIGRYKLLQQIGEGGWGVVYMAEQQEPVKRLVALKVIKAGMDTRQTLARFEAERQALALMEHRNIAKVLDAGATEAGRPFFVMELVRGMKITDYCDDPQSAMSTEQRLNLFIQVCQAIQHAHQKGVIHRDIKPSNVLVTSQEDGTPTPKVIDFGIAKATAGQTLTGKTVFTAFEQFVGTPAYMSPEQAAMTSPDIDTRSDIYSLGVLLYELLTGKTPFDSNRLLEAGFNEVRRIICEEQPPRPSTRLRTLGADEQTDVAKRRQSDPPELLNRLRGDLDWIVMKCLEKDRARRYDTANGLAVDVQRHLQNQPVVACPPSYLYRLRKLVRRHKLGFAAATAVAVCFSIGLWELGLHKRAQWRLMVNEANLRQQAQAEAQRAQAAATEAKQILAVSDFAQAVHLIAEGKGDDALAHLARSLSLNPQAEAAATELATWLTTHSWTLPQASFRVSNSISSARLGPDGKYALTISADWTVRVWDVRTGALVSDSAKHQGEIKDAEFSPDSRRILTASEDGSACVWDAQTGRPLSLPLNHRDRVNWAQFSRDGNFVVTASRDHTARLWDWRTGRPQGEPLVHDGEVRWAEFSPDGTLVVTASDDTTARLWDARNGRMILPPLKHAGRVVSAQFSPDGTRIVTACPESTARVWSAKTGLPLTDPFTGTFGVWIAQFSPDGKTIISTSWGRKACLWSADTGQQVLAPMEHGDMVASEDISSDGTLVLTGSRDCTARLWDIETVRPRGEPMRHGDGVVWTQFSSDGQRALVASRDGTACIWDIRRAQPLVKSLKHGVGPHELHFNPDGTGLKWMNAFLLAAGFGQFSPDGKRVVTASSQNTARVWDTDTGQLLAESASHGDAVCSAQFSPDGRLIVTASRDNTARIWDPETVRPVGEPMRHGGWVFAARFSPDSKRIVTASQDGTARIWDTRTGQPLAEPLRHGAGVLCAEFNYDGSRVLTASWDGTARVWDAETGQPRSEPLRHSSWVWSARFSADGARVVTASEDQTARVWDTKTGLPITPPLRHGTAVYMADFSPDGKQIVTASAAAEARIWDAQKGQLLTEPFKHADTVHSARFSSDGKWLVTASWDGTARVWDARTGLPLTESLKHDGPVWFAQFSPGGQQLLTASADGTARVWDIAPSHGHHPDWLLRLAEAVSGRTLNRAGVLETIASNRAEILNEIRNELALEQNDQDDWVVWGRWLLGDRSNRNVSPFSKMTITQYIEEKVKANTSESLAELDQFAHGDAELSRRIIRTRERLQPDFALARQAALLVSRGNSQARAGQWTNAIATFSKLAELQPDNYENYHSLAALFVQSGETEAYSRQCAYVLSRFGMTREPVTAERLTKDCLIIPFRGDLSRLAGLADTAVRLGTNHTSFIYFQFAKGLADYRQNHFETAAQLMAIVAGAGGAPTRQAEAQSVLAMAQFRMNHSDEARHALAAAVEIVDQKLPKLDSGDIGEGWIDWIIAGALVCEAKGLLGGPFAAEHP